MASGKVRKEQSGALAHGALPSAPVLGIFLAQTLLSHMRRMMHKVNTLRTVYMSDLAQNTRNTPRQVKRSRLVLHLH